MAKFGLPEAWIALALFSLIFAEYVGAFLARRFLHPRPRGAARRAIQAGEAASTDAEPPSSPETGP